MVVVVAVVVVVVVVVLSVVVVGFVFGAGGIGGGGGGRASHIRVISSHAAKSAALQGCTSVELLRAQSQRIVDLLLSYQQATNGLRLQTIPGSSS